LGGISTLSWWWWKRMSLYEWKELKKTIPLFEDRGPELRTMDNKVTG
jgi:hypothetical protein